MLLVASLYDNAFSKQFAVRLQISVEALKIKCRLFDRVEKLHHSREVSWRPKAILLTLLAYPQDDVLLVDPDTVFERRPDILLRERDFDAALHYDVATLHPSGPLYFRNNDRSRHVLKVWDEMNQLLPESPELGNLSRILGQKRLKLDVRRLPVTYAWVERLHRKRHPGALPVITHFMTDHMITTRIKVR